MAYHQMLNYFLTMHLFSVMHDINAFASVLNGDFGMGLPIENELPSSW